MLYCVVGMLNKLNESKLLLLSRYAQLQGDCNELEVSKRQLETCLFNGIAQCVNARK